MNRAGGGRGRIPSCPPYLLAVLLLHFSRHFFLIVALLHFLLQLAHLLLQLSLLHGELGHLFLRVNQPLMWVSMGERGWVSASKCRLIAGPGLTLSRRWTVQRSEAMAMAHPSGTAAPGPATACTDCE